MKRLHLSICGKIKVATFLLLTMQSGTPPISYSIQKGTWGLWLMEILQLFMIVRARKNIAILK
jgi:hypothetical protein